MEIQIKNGFTLIELMIALVIAAILLGVGIPSFSSAIANSRMSGTYNDVAQTLYIARSEAVKGSEKITICPRAEGDDNSCGTDWSTGLLVFIDNDPVRIDAEAEFGIEDVALHSQRKFKKGSTITATQSRDRSVGNIEVAKWIRYSSSGATTWGNGTFSICDDKRGAEYSRALNVVATGDIRRGRPVSATDITPGDVFGNPITCP